LKAASIIRVHDIKEAIETKKIIEAITNPEITLQ
jgi:dihydropteroate synthase